ncbi:MAG: hypothetical protein OEZ19_03630 [Paracoccaceae bacterium]|nr:hypothetical protein [Paracoccaceae bacterium]
MSKSIKTVLVLGLVAFVAACAGATDPVEPAPIMAEPTSNKM